MRVKYISVWEMNNQLGVHMIMIYQWNVYVSVVYVKVANLKLSCDYIYMYVVVMLVVGFVTCVSLMQLAFQPITIITAFI